MKYCFVPKNEFVFKQDSFAENFFIISEGVVSVIIEDKEIKELSNEDYFGDIAILYGCKRSAGIKTKTDTYLWALNQKTYLKFTRQLRLKNQKENRLFIDKVPFFGKISFYKRKIDQCTKSSSFNGNEY